MNHHNGRSATTVWSTTGEDAILACSGGSPVAPLSGSGFPSRELSIRLEPDGFDTGWESRPTGGAAAGGVMGNRC